jgi:RNA polymerase sigma-70 factor (ECF subfamily)
VSDHVSNKKSFSFLECLLSETKFNEYMSVAKQGSRSGLGNLLEAFRPALIDMAEQKLGGRIRRRMSSSDLVQDTLLTAGNQFESFRGSSLPEFQQWLRELFHSRLIDGLRRHQIAEKRRQDSEDEYLSLSSLTSQNDTPSVLVSRQEEATRILEALENLSDEHQRVIQLRYIENLTFEAIAEHLNVSVATVWRRFHEAVESLQRRLQP